MNKAKSTFPTPKNLESSDDIPFILISEELYKKHKYIAQLLTTNSTLESKFSQLF
jgi:hypothetical protein